MEKRPKFPTCVMTSGIISRIRSDQDVWDREHPEEAEEMRQNGEID